MDESEEKRLSATKYGMIEFSTPGSGDGASDLLKKARGYSVLLKDDIDRAVNRIANDSINAGTNP